jgi:hypothetical protein
MREIIIPLVEDAELRDSLRRLYPEVPPWIREWLIVEPGAPLPRPPYEIVHRYVESPVLLKELEDTCAAVNAAGPEEPWITHHDSYIVWAGPAHSGLADRQPHPQAEGRLVAFNLGRHPFPDPSEAAFPIAGVFQVAPARLSLGLAGVSRYWRLEGTGLRIRGQILESSQLALRHIQGDSVQHLRECGNPMVAANVEPSANLLMADGTGEELLLDEEGRPYAEEAILVADHLEAAITQELSRLALLRRWRALPSAADQVRIAAFWLGHPHPVLATAGLAVAAELPEVRSTRRQHV